MNSDRVQPRLPSPATPRELLHRIAQSVRALMIAYNAYRTPPREREIRPREVAE